MTDTRYALRVRNGKVIVASGADLKRYPVPTEEQLREARAKLAEAS